MSDAYLKIRPLTINKAFQGRRFKTKDYIIYEHEALIRLASSKSKKKDDGGWEKVAGWVEIRYEFHIKNYKITDVGNLEKLISDIVVKAGMIEDDRFIKRLDLEKFQCFGNDEYIVISIKPYV